MKPTKHNSLGLREIGHSVSLCKLGRSGTLYAVPAGLELVAKENVLGNTEVT